MTMRREVMRPSAVGNRIATEYVFFGLTDGANESRRLREPVVSAGERAAGPARARHSRTSSNRIGGSPSRSSTSSIKSGNIEIGGYPEFLGPEWGHVGPFSLTPAQRIDYERDGDCVSRVPRPRELHPWSAPMTSS